jgi:enamine deaminase RidA (YjgF/YER057c/UK114 family)
MSRIVKHQGTTYLYGPVCADATQDIEHQTQSLLEKIDQLLFDADSDREHMLSATIYIKDMQDFAVMNAVWNSRMNGCYANVGGSQESVAILVNMLR